MNTEIIKASFFIFEGEFVMKTLIKESIFGVGAIESIFVKGFVYAKSFIKFTQHFLLK